MLPLFWLNLQLTGSSSGASSGNSLVRAGLGWTFEMRTRFPLVDDTTMGPTQLNGALVTLSSGSLSSAAFCSLWYEKSAVGSLTGNIYLTSSAGRLQLTSASIFDDNFYNLAVVKDPVTGSYTVSVNRYDSDELVYSTSSVASYGAPGAPFLTDYTRVDLGSAIVQTLSYGEFWAQEFRLWSAALTETELLDHADNFESYGRDSSFNNGDLRIHWRLNDGVTAVGNAVYVGDSTPAASVGTGSNFVTTVPFTKFLENYSYIPSIDYGWNQEKVRVFDGTSITPDEVYEDERFLSLEFNMYDALDEDISHVMSSYDELNSILGQPMNRYRVDYEGLQQMRETYFKRLQGPLNFRVFVDMLDFFDSTFMAVIEKLLPARTGFKGDELVVESHMLERPKYQYQIRPIHEGMIDVSGTICVADRGWDLD